ncbi:MAG: T9SS type A sorting domain-containing protein, partial [Bacteroidota bacterium]
RSRRRAIPLSALVQTATQLWHRNAYHLSNDDKTRDLGVFVNQDNSIIHIVKTGSSNELDPGDGFGSNGYPDNNFGIIWHVGSDGVAIAVDHVSDLFSEIGFANVHPNLNWTKVQRNTNGELVWFGELNGACTLNNGDLISASDYFVPNFSPGRDAVVMVTEPSLDVISWAYKTGSGRQRYLDGAVLPNGQLVGTGVHYAESSQFGTPTTEFGDDSLIGSSEEDAFMVVLTPGDIPDEVVDSIDELNAPSVELFPNPNNGTFYLKPSNGVEVQQVLVFDAASRKVFEEQPTKQQFQLELNPGVYTLSVMSNQGVITNRLIIQ